MLICLVLVFAKLVAVLATQFKGQVLSVAPNLTGIRLIVRSLRQSQVELCGSVPQFNGLLGAFSPDLFDNAQYCGNVRAIGSSSKLISRMPLCSSTTAPSSSWSLAFALLVSSKLLDLHPWHSQLSQMTLLRLYTTQSGLSMVNSYVPTLLSEML